MGCKLKSNINYMKSGKTEMKNMLVVAFAALVLGVQSAPMHRGYEQPSYTIISKGSGYELRKYSPAYWLSTDVYTADKDQALGVGYSRLFQYIHGENVAGMGNLRAVPVLMRVEDACY